MRKTAVEVNQNQYSVPSTARPGFVFPPSIPSIGWRGLGLENWKLGQDPNRIAGDVASTTGGFTRYADPKIRDYKLNVTGV